MKEKKEGIGKFISACSEVLRVSKKYSYLWDDKELIDGSLAILGHWWAQDEYVSVFIAKKGNKLLFSSKDFDDNLAAKKAAHKIRGLYNISAKDIKEGFYSSLEKPLGKYLAREEIKKIRNLTNLAS